MYQVARHFIKRLLQIHILGKKENHFNAKCLNHHTYLLLNVFISLVTVKVHFYTFQIGQKM